MGIKNLIMDIVNAIPLDDPEGFHTRMIAEGVKSILYQCNTLKKYWDEEIELSEGLIQKIVEESKKVMVDFSLIFKRDYHRLSQTI